MKSDNVNAILESLFRKKIEKSGFLRLIWLVVVPKINNPRTAQGATRRARIIDRTPWFFKKNISFSTKFGSILFLSQTVGHKAPKN